MGFWERWGPVYAGATVLVVVGIILEILERRKRASKKSDS
jgi:hypothetical protein